MTFHRTVANAIALSIFSCAALAHAGGDAQNTGTARELYDQGVTALDGGDAR